MKVTEDSAWLFQVPLARSANGEMEELCHDSVLVKLGSVAVAVKDPKSGAESLSE